MNEKKKTNEQLINENRQLREQIECFKKSKPYNKTDEISEINYELLMQSEKLAVLGRLVSGIAHEINNPNNFIMMNIPLLQKSWKSIEPVLDSHYNKNTDYRIAGISYSSMKEKLPKICSNILEGSWRIKRIVDDLKKYSRNSPDKEFTPIDVNSVVESSVNLIFNFIRKSTDAFHMELADKLPPVKGSFQHLEQALINIIQNACQSLLTKDSPVVVKTCFSKTDEVIVIYISDRGRGIAPEDIRKIFDPFFTTRTEFGGTGLGLSISRKIIHEMEGRLEFNSELNHGTTVNIFLPAAVDDSLKNS